MLFACTKINRLGDHFEAPHLAEFTTLWMSLFSHSSQTKFLWKSQAGKAMQTYSSTRWWEYFGDVESFLRNITNIGSSLRPKLLVFFDEKAFLQLELAAVVDCGKQFVEACHMLEGDGPLA